MVKMYCVSEQLLDSHGLRNKLRQWMQQMENLVHNVPTSVTTQLQNSELNHGK
jgi:hypothetical protein